MIFIVGWMQMLCLAAQQLYDDVETNRQVHYGLFRGSKIDSMASNPSPDAVNSSPHCIRYLRSRLKYDCLRIFPRGKIADVSAYASYEPTAPKLRMKVYTTAPVGTLVEIQLGKKTEVAYPDGVHSHYQARTSVQNAWQELEFQYAFSPEHSKTSAGEVEYLTLLVNPGTVAGGTFYFDDLTGPAIQRTDLSARSRKKNR